VSSSGLSERYLAVVNKMDAARPTTSTPLSRTFTLNLTVVDQVYLGFGTREQRGSAM
jgi:hypothetical protein